MKKRVKLQTLGVDKGYHNKKFVTGLSQRDTNKLLKND